MPKEKPSQVLTGSTGNAARDMQPRGAFMGFMTALATVGCLTFSTNAELTGAIFGATLNGSYLAMLLFDWLVKPQFDK